MALPTVVGKIKEPYVIGGTTRRHPVIIAGPTLYVVGGVVLTANDLGDTWIENIQPAISTDGTHIAYFIPERADGLSKQVKMLIVVVATGVEAAAVDLSTKKFIVSADCVG